jgi:hypothetical protein
MASVTPPNTQRAWKRWDALVDVVLAWIMENLSQKEFSTCVSR